MENKEMTEEMVKEMVEETRKQFITKYKEDLDDNIKKMLEIFGFNGNIENVDEWMREEKYELLMDEEETDRNSKKCFYLIDRKLDTIVSIFTVKLTMEGYEFSDILYRIIAR